mmetsp:Transcript_72056/g.168791  ORF Transcript_72056/g.168791 Transcript_72056/m.168791 type:complete len:201 (-) Transcript_72056:721-1323(-)
MHSAPTSNRLSWSRRRPSCLAVYPGPSAPASGKPRSVGSCRSPQSFPSSAAGSWEPCQPACTLAQTHSVRGRPASSSAPRCLASWTSVSAPASSDRAGSAHSELHSRRRSSSSHMLGSTHGRDWLSAKWLEQPDMHSSDLGSLRASAPLDPPPSSHRSPREELSRSQMSTRQSNPRPAVPGALPTLQQCWRRPLRLALRP